MKSERKEKMVSLAAGKKVLNVGCSYDFHKSVADVATEAVGIDLDLSAIERLKDEGYDVFVDDAQDFYFNEDFDMILAGELIEHLSNPGNFLNCAGRHLRKDGRLVLSTPNQQSLHKILENHTPFVRDSPNHVIGFSHQLLRQLLKRNGFEVLQMENVRHGASSFKGKFFHFVVPNSWKSTIFCVARVKE